jgi:hypothetical protein
MLNRDDLIDLLNEIKSLKDESRKKAIETQIDI